MIRKSVDHLVLMIKQSVQAASVITEKAGQTGDPAETTAQAQRAGSNDRDQRDGESET